MSQENTEYLLARHEQATAQQPGVEQSARVAHLELAYRYSLMLMETTAVSHPASRPEIGRG